MIPLHRANIYKNRQNWQPFQSTANWPTADDEQKLLFLKTCWILDKSSRGVWPPRPELLRALCQLNEPGKCGAGHENEHFDA